MFRLLGLYLGTLYIMHIDIYKYPAAQHVWRIHLVTHTYMLIKQNIARFIHGQPRSSQIKEKTCMDIHTVRSYGYIEGDDSKLTEQYVKENNI